MKKASKEGLTEKVTVATKTDYPVDSYKSTTKNASRQVIDIYASEQLSPGIDEMIDVNAVVTTDGASLSVVGKRMHVALDSSVMTNFEGLNYLYWCIFNLKNWIITIYQDVSSFHMKR